MPSLINEIIIIRMEYYNNDVIILLLLPLPGRFKITLSDCHELFHTHKHLGEHVHMHTNEARGDSSRTNCTMSCINLILL